MDFDFFFQAVISFFQRNFQIIADIRPACSAEASGCCTGYRELQSGTICRETAESLLPDRATLGLVWRYLSGCGSVRETPMCLLRKIVRWSGKPMTLGKLLTCLDIFADVDLIQIQRLHKYMAIELLPRSGKADLTTSKTMRTLTEAANR